MVLCELLEVEVLVVWGCVGCFAVTTCVGLATVSLLLLTTAVLSCVVMVIVALSCAAALLIVALSCAVVFCVVVQTIESGSIYVWSIRRPPSLLNRPLLSSIKDAFASGAVRPWRRRNASMPSLLRGESISCATSGVADAKRKMSNMIVLMYAFMSTNIVKIIGLLVVGGIYLC